MKKTSNRLRSLGAVLAVLALLLALAVPAFAVEGGFADLYTWRTVPICAETCPRNPAMEQVLQRFTSQVDEKYSHIVGRFRRELTHPERTQETELGNLFADIFTRSLGIDVMLIGSGSIRAEKLGPIVTYGDLIEGLAPSRAVSALWSWCRTTPQTAIRPTSLLRLLHPILQRSPITKPTFLWTVIGLFCSPL